MKSAAFRMPTISLHVVIFLVFFSLSYLGGFAQERAGQTAAIPLMLASVLPMLALYRVHTVVLFLILTVCLLFLRRLSARGNLAQLDDRAFLSLSFVAYLFLLTRLWQFPFSVDDSYIDYRYVHHWLAGIADYNPGERIMGFTSLSHVLLLMAIKFAFSGYDLPLLSLLANTYLEIVTSVCLYFLLTKLTGKSILGLVGAFIYCANIYALQDTLNGKETAMCALLQTVALIALVSSRYYIFAACAALLFLTRPEGALWCGLAFLYTVHKTKRDAVKYWLGPILCIALIYGFLFCFVGTVIPHGYLAKSKVFYGMDGINAYVMLVDRFGTNVLNGMYPALITGGRHAIASIFVRLGEAILVMVVAFFAARRKPLGFYFLACLLQFVFLFAGRLQVLFGWYMCWFVLFPSILFAVSADYFLSLSAHAGVLRRAGMLALSCWLLAYCGNFLKPALFYYVRQREIAAVYARIATLLVSQRGNRQTIAMPDIGAFGYYYDGPVIDLMGLVSEAPLAFQPAPLAVRNPHWMFAINPESIKKLKPGYVFTINGFADGGLLQDREFRSMYTLDYQSEDKLFFLFRRGDIVVPPFIDKPEPVLDINGPLMVVPGKS